jgi:nicotinamide-nucleotide amidase
MANIIANIITIGDELLIGQTIDTNSAWIARQLNHIGIKIGRRVAVADDYEQIRLALDQERASARLIFITGGLGPTSDDITKPLLLQYFGGTLVRNEEALAHITAIFSKRNLPMLDVNIKQAEVPDSCEVLQNKLGTAPGMLFKAANKHGEEQWFISMPGVPHEMMGIMTDLVIPMIGEHFPSDAYRHVTIVTAGQGESFIAERIRHIEEALPAHIRLAYLPGYRMVKLRLTGTGPDADLLDRELKQYGNQLAETLADLVVAKEDLTYEFIVGYDLTTMGKTLALAESCTGGYISHQLTQVSGAGNYLKGGVVCYDTHVKEELLRVDPQLIEEQGAVSAAVARELAINVRKLLHSDIGFGITGLLTHAQNEQVPSGTVFMAIASDDRVITEEFHFSFDRIRNKEVAMQSALLFIWKFLNNKI